MAPTSQAGESAAPAGEPARATRARKFTGSPTSVVGESLITLGLLLGLLVVWELFWTDVGANREQSAVVAAVDDEWSSEGAPLDIAGQTGGDLSYPLLAEEAHHYDDDPPVMEPPENAGKTFAMMYVPRWGQDYIKPISEGVSRSKVLDSKGIGHYPKSQMPGDVGNFATAAHRTTYGKPFTNIQNLRKRDYVVVRTQDVWFVYKVIDHEIVAPNDISVVSRDPFKLGGNDTHRYLTMTSCHPRFSALQRYVVHGELAYWAYVADGYPPELFPNAPVGA